MGLERSEHPIEAYRISRCGRSFRAPELEGFDQSSRIPRTAPRRRADFGVGCARAVKALHPSGQRVVVLAAPATVDEHGVRSLLRTAWEGRAIVQSGDEHLMQ